MSIRVLDPDGRVMRPVSPSNARSWVEHQRARWLHIEGVQPNMRHGTVILNHPIKKLLQERTMAQIFNADGEFLGWLWKETAELWIRKGHLEQVGTSSDDGPRAAILPHMVSPKGMEEIRRVEGRRISEDQRARAIARREIEYAVSESTISGGALETMVLKTVQQRLGKSEAELALSDLRTIRRRLKSMDIAFAPDMAKIRRQLSVCYET